MSGLESRDIALFGDWQFKSFYKLGARGVLKSKAKELSYQKAISVVRKYLILKALESKTPPVLTKINRYSKEVTICRSGYNYWKGGGEPTKANCRKYRK